MGERASAARGEPSGSLTPRGDGRLRRLLKRGDDRGELSGVLPFGDDDASGVSRRLTPPRGEAAEGGECEGDERRLPMAPRDGLLAEFSRSESPFGRPAALLVRTDASRSPPPGRFALTLAGAEPIPAAALAAAISIIPSLWVGGGRGVSTQGGVSAQGGLPWEGERLLLTPVKVDGQTADGRAVVAHEHG